MVYDVERFHGTNAVARELESLKGMLNHVGRNMWITVTMEIIAESITETRERQEFLKRLYETFYAKYDPKRADRDGIVYTPSEVVDFIVKSTNYLLKRTSDVASRMRRSLYWIRSLERERSLYMCWSRSALTNWR